MYIPILPPPPPCPAVNPLNQLAGDVIRHANRLSTANDVRDIRQAIMTIEFFLTQIKDVLKNDN